VLQIDSASPYQGTILIEAEMDEGNLLCLRSAFTCGKRSQHPIFILWQVNRDQLRKHQSRQEWHFHFSKEFVISKLFSCPSGSKSYHFKILHERRFQP